jgi:hypothetical protein
MARRSDMAIRLTIRAVVARGEPFVPLGEALADPDVALDEIMSLTSNSEPLVLRVSVRGGRARDRAKVAGDWLCAADGKRPRLLPYAAWTHSPEAAAWAKGKTWLEAWERCDDAPWMLHAASVAGVDRRLAVFAACACARTSLHLVPEGECRPLRAIETAEDWARGRATTRKTKLAGTAANEASWDLQEANEDAASWAAAAAYASTLAVTIASSIDAQDTPLATASPASKAAIAIARNGGYGYAKQVLHLIRLADIVREKVPTLAVLKAAAGAL